MTHHQGILRPQKDECFYRWGRDMNSQAVVVGHRLPKPAISTTPPNTMEASLSHYSRLPQPPPTYPYHLPRLRLQHLKRRHTLDQSS